MTRKQQQLKEQRQRQAALIYAAIHMIGEDMASLGGDTGIDRVIMAAYTLCFENSREDVIERIETRLEEQERFVRGRG